MTADSKRHLENAALDWPVELSYAILRGPMVAVGEPAAERSNPNRREALLPRFISGELRVKDAERAVEAVA